MLVILLLYGYYFYCFGSWFGIEIFDLIVFVKFLVCVGSTAYFGYIMHMRVTFAFEGPDCEWSSECV